MKYLLDTNVLIDLLRGDQDIIKNLQTVTIDECCITDITAYELFYGAYKSKDPQEAVSKIYELIHSIPILATLNYMQEAARQKSILATNGNLIEDFDIIIGSAALINNLTLVSGNLKHMERLNSLDVISWKEA